MALGLGLALPYRAPSGGLTAVVRAMFGTSKGVMYDLTDKSNLYQDSARTTLVSANGDPIGSVTDLSPNLRHASQATAASRPLWNSGGFAALDGADDSWATAAIDFTGTDKVTVVVSARMADTPAAMLVELGASVGTTNGSFYITSPEGAGGTIGFRVRGTAEAGFNSSVRGVPFTGVLTLLGNIAGATVAAECIPRINGVVDQTTLAGSASTGNFGNLALNIGRRNNTSLPFEGRIYRLIVIGRVLTAAELALAERWAGQPAGIVL